MPEELQPFTLVVAGSSPAPATRRQGSSVVEHENVSPTLVARSRQMPKELHSRVANVQVRVLLLPCRIVQSVETRPLISSILVVGLLNFWCGGFIGAPQPFTNECWQDYIEGNFIVLRARGFNLANHSSFVWANADRITLDFAGSIPARSLLRKSCLFCRPPGECRQDYNLSRYMSCHLLVAALL